VARAITLGKRENGEPGLWNISLARQADPDVVSPNPCGEIGLVPFENCNLGHINMEYFAPNPSSYRPVTTMKEAFRLMARWLVRATFGDIPQPRQRAIVDKNRRIGVGFFGYHAWLALHGVRYSDGYKTPWVVNTLKEMKQTVVESATSYAQRLGIPVPVKFTTLAPTGTIATLPGTTGSGQSMMAPWFKRLVRYSDMDKQIDVLRAEGYEVFRDDDAKNTSIAVFWCEDPLVTKVRAIGFDPADVLESQYEVTMESSLATQAMFQDVYVDNAVSFTINLRPEDMPPEEEMERLLMTYLPRLKGTTVFPEKSRKNTPIQPITKEDFDAHLGPKQITAIEVECVGGCPVK
jgi:adenosylcobalamin-dependent ribonucleoside-triphosphate reductase